MKQTSKPIASIRGHLLFWLLLPITVLCFVCAFVTYSLAVDFATDAFDEALLDDAHSVASRISFKNSTLDVDMPAAAKAILKHGDKDNTYYQIISPDGNLISGDAFIPDLPAGTNLEVEPPFYDGNIDGRPVRCGAIGVTLPDGKKRAIIKVAETIAGRMQLIQNIVLGVSIPQLVLIMLSALAVWLGVSNGLAPLGRLKEAVESRNPTDLSPVPEDTVPREVKPLVVSINNLLDQLQEDRESQKRFLSNAAHQLRTPLAGLKTQTELALRQTDPHEVMESLQQISTSAGRATRLAQQLLALARVEPSVFKNVSHDALDINKIAREATRELVVQSMAKQIDLGFENSPQPEIVAGDRASLYEMMFNLIENAVFYTQRGGRITVSIQAGEKGPVFAVEDNGPGIPPAERQRVFERFYRVLGNKVSGSGLGLAIVREIAEAHEAEVILKDGAEGVGTLAEVYFKKADVLPAQPALVAGPGAPGA